MTQLSTSLRLLLQRWRIPEDVILVVLSLIIGLSVGLITVGTVFLVDLIALLSENLQDGWGFWRGRLLWMMGAGFLVGLIAWKLAPEIRGSGIPEVMEATALRSGWIRTRVIPLKAIATALTIGAGGSAGREGPIVQIGAAFGSSLGRVLHVNTEKMKTLVSCGAAAGIAAAFNAPIAASIFALEGVLGSFNVRSFGTVVISAVAGSVVSHLVLGDEPAFLVPIYPLNHPAELFIYAGLGVLAALLAGFFIYSRQWSGRFFAALPIFPPFKTALGMALTGLIALTLPNWEVGGSGLHWIGDIIASNHELVAQPLLLLIFCKIVATCFTLGGGASGGVFAPSLFLGAALGGLVGSYAHSLWPNTVVDPGAYAIVGMAAVFSAAVRTPITAVIIVFEMSNDYELILPLLLATGISTVLAELWTGDSLYTLVLKERGITLQNGRDVDVLDSLLIGEIMTRDLHTVTCGTTLPELSDLFSHTHNHAFIVLDERGRLDGIVTITDLDRAILEQMPRRTKVEEVGTPFDQMVVAYPEETMGEAIMRMGQRGFSHLPVVTHEDPRHIVGMIQHDEIIRSYNMALTSRSELIHRAKRSQVQIDSETEFVDLILHQRDRAIGRTLTELGPELPLDCILISIHRGGKTLIPHGNTIFRPGDDVTAFVCSRDFEKLYACLKGNSQNG